MIIKPANRYLLAGFLMYNMGDGFVEIEGV